MELLLWRWSTTAQIASALTIAVFFFVLGRSVRRFELRPWVYAWLANVGAMGVTIVFWFAQPESQAAFLVLRWAYFFCKTSFVALLMAGAWTFTHRRPSNTLVRRILIGTAIGAAAGAVFLDSINLIGVAQSATIAVFLATGAVVLLPGKMPGARWLAGGFAMRALLGVVETLAYTSRLVPNAWSASADIGVFLASHSSFDTAAEWVIALGCVLTLYGTIQQELTQANADLLQAHEVLQDLVDRDSLTGLSNRRVLPAVLREAFATGATILFFDLNDFKDINDSYGHQAGDECLKRFGAVLQASFRPEDHVIRYAGDEFVVVARDARPEEVLIRVEVVRERLHVERAFGPHIRFSVGHQYLPPQGEPEAALRAADEAMYRDKARKTQKMKAV